MTVVHGVLRSRGGSTRVTFFELFLDLVFVFAVTQLSHRLLEHLTPKGAAETLLLLLAVWWAWVYTSWTTNWFDPDHAAVRVMLSGVMLASLVMAAMLPGAFGGHDLWFAVSYAVIQIGRTVFVVVVTWATELGPTFRRILTWCCVGGGLWIGGAFADGDLRIWIWVLALALEYFAPWHGYMTPGMGRSSTTEWTIDGAHMAERCQLFIIIALGESLLVTGATFGGLEPTFTTVVALAVAFAGSVALWWIYFDRSADAAADQIAASDDPGRLARSAYTYIHIPMVAGIIVVAVADELVVAHPTGHMTTATAAVTLGGPALFVAGHALFKKVVFGHFTRARVLALAALAVLALVSGLFNPLALAIAATAVVVALAFWDVASNRRRERAGAFDVV